MQSYGKLRKANPDDAKYAAKRGWLRNPKTGRVFRANSVTARRIDLERVDGPEDALKPTVTTSRDKTPADENPVVETQTDEPVSKASPDDMANALDDVVERAKKAKTKDELVGIGTELGLTLVKDDLTAKKMVAAIEEHVEKLRQFDI